VLIDMLFRRKKVESSLDLSVDEINDLIRSNLEYAEQCAREGNVSGMEMALEVALEQARKVSRTLKSSRISEIKLTGYERGVESLQGQIKDLEGEGKSVEAQRLQMLLESYFNEAELLRRALR
jgi:TATA-binding protein-associated factor Taf7